MSDRMVRVRDRRKKGWFSIDNWLIDDFGSDLGAYAIATYAVLCRHASNEDASCQVSINTIARKIAASRNTVKSGLKSLESLGLIAIEPQYDGDRQFASEYVLLQPRIPQGGSGDDQGQEMTGVTPRPGVGQEMTGGGSPDGHLYKYQLEKDLTKKTVPLRELNRVMEIVRGSSAAPDHLVSVGLITADHLEALRSHNMFRLELEKIEDERRSKSWIPH